MADVVLFGVGQISDVIHFYLTHDSPHRVVAFTVDSDYVSASQHQGLPVVAFEEVDRYYPPDRYAMHLPMSYRKVNRLRAEKYEAARTRGYELISYVSTKAAVWPGLIIGDNCVVLEQSVVQPFVEIGSNVMLWTGATVAHHSRVGSHCFIASHVVISGNVVIEPYCFLGANSTIRDGITIAADCIIGAGALIVKDAQAGSVHRGSVAHPHSLRSDQLPGF